MFPKAIGRKYHKARDVEQQETTVSQLRERSSESTVDRAMTDVAGSQEHWLAFFRTLGKGVILVSFYVNLTQTRVIWEDGLN